MLIKNILGSLFVMAALCEGAVAASENWNDLFVRGQLALSQNKASEAESIWRAALKQCGADAKGRVNYALVANNLASICKRKGSYSEAESLYKEAVAIAEKNLGRDHNDTATYLGNLAGLFVLEGRFAEAEPLLKEVLAFRRKSLGNHHSETAKSLNNLAFLFQRSGRFSQAEPLYKEAIAITQSLREDHPDTPQYLSNLGTIYQLEGRYADAEPKLEEALALRRKLLGNNHRDTAQSMNNLAVLRRAQGRYADAEALFEEALTIARTIYGEQHPNTAVCLNNLGNLYQTQGRYADAERLYRESLAVSEKVFGNDSIQIAESINNLASIYKAQERHAEAEPLYKQSLDITRKAYGNDHLDTARAKNNLALLYRSQGRFDYAEPLLKEALETRRKILGTDHPITAASMNNLATLYFSMDKLADAEPLFKEALRIRKKALGEEHSDVSASVNNLAALYKEQKRYAEALPLLEEGLAISRKSLGVNHPDTVLSTVNLATIYLLVGRYADAEILYKNAQKKSQGSGATKIHSQQLFRNGAEIQSTALSRLRESNGSNGRNSEDLEFLIRHMNGLEKFPDIDSACLQSVSLEQLPLIECALLELSNRDPNRDIVPLLMTIEERHIARYGKDSPFVADNQLSIAYRFMALDGEPQVLALSSASIFEKLAKQILGAPVPDSAPSMVPHKAGTTSTRKTDNKSADTGISDYLGQWNSRAIAMEALGRSLLCNGFLLAQCDEQPRAVVLAELASQIVTQTDSKLSATTKVSILLEIAELLKLIGNLASAHRNLEYAMVACNGNSKVDPALKTNVFIAQTVLAFEQADYQSAIDLGLKTLASQSIQDKSMLSTKLRLLLSMAQAAIGTGDNKQALAWAGDALSLVEQSKREEKGEDDIERRVTTELVFAQALLCDNRASEATSKLTDSLGECFARSRRDKPTKSKDESLTPMVSKEVLADVYFSLAESQLADKQWKQARLNFSKSFDIHRKSVSRYSIRRIIDTLFEMAICDANSGDQKSASNLANQAATFLTIYIRDTYPDLPFAEQKSFLQKLKVHTSMLLALRHDEKTIADTYFYLMRWRGLLIEGIRRESLLRSTQDNPVLKPIYLQLVSVKQELAKLGSADGAKIPGTEDKIKQLTEKKESLTRQLLTGLKAVDPLDSVPVASFQKMLGEEEAFIDLFTYQPYDSPELHHAAIVSTRQDTRFIDIAGAKAITEAINTWREFGLSSNSRGTKVKQLRDQNDKPDKSWSYLRDSLWQPILACLPTQCKRLIVCDDEHLSRIPWEKLVNDGPPERTFLVARIDSPREFVTLKRKAKPVSERDNQALLVGGIDYADSRLHLNGTLREVFEIRNILKDVSEEQSKSGVANGGASDPHVQLPTVKTTILTGKQPTKQRVEELLQKANIVHLATHGFFAESDPMSSVAENSRALRVGSIFRTLAATRNPLIASGILLAPEKHTRSERDENSSSKTKTVGATEGSQIDQGESKLTAEEMVSLDLQNCDVIVLSACETGRGTEERGQGVLGLRSAIMSAGARTIVLSLWPVDDAATRCLMTEFYNQWKLKGKSKVEALTLAQAAVRNNKEHPEWKEPYYWAAWVLVGQGW